jgi:hypothetical protein
MKRIMFGMGFLILALAHYLLYQKFSDRSALDLLRIDLMFSMILSSPFYQVSLFITNVYMLFQCLFVYPNKPEWMFALNLGGYLGLFVLLCMVFNLPMVFFLVIFIAASYSNIRLK